MFFLDLTKFRDREIFFDDSAKLEFLNGAKVAYEMIVGGGFTF